MGDRYLSSWSKTQVNTHTLTESHTNMVRCIMPSATESSDVQVSMRSSGNIIRNTSVTLQAIRPFTNHSHGFIMSSYILLAHIRLQAGPTDVALRVILSRAGSVCPWLLQLVAQVCLDESREGENRQNKTE
ncbi:TPA: hypothetical protein ACH3X1_015367 [Trebouxia sp. C0004]